MSYCTRCGKQLSYCAYCGKEKTHNCNESVHDLMLMGMGACSCNTGSASLEFKYLPIPPRRKRYCTGCGERISYDAFTGEQKSCKCDFPQKPSTIHPSQYSHINPDALLRLQENERILKSLERYKKIVDLNALKPSKPQYCTSCGEKRHYCPDCGKRELCECDRDDNAAWNHHSYCNCKKPSVLW